MAEDDTTPIPEPTGGPAPEPERKAPAEWARIKGTLDWQYAGAHAGNRWAVFDLPITETEYDAAIAKAVGVVCR
jgi:hypothetical protein